MVSDSPAGIIASLAEKMSAYLVRDPELGTDVLASIVEASEASPVTVIASPFGIAEPSASQSRDLLKAQLSALMTIDHTLNGMTGSAEESS